jgi:ABC-type transporter Mla subunit MlaD
MVPVNPDSRKLRRMLGPYINQIAQALVGMPYPARRWQILAWAEYNGAGSPLRMALLEIPEKSYGSLGEIKANVLPEIMKVVDSRGHL